MRILYKETTQIAEGIQDVELEFFMNGIEFLNNRPTIEKVISKEYVGDFTLMYMTDGEPIDGWDKLSTMKELWISQYDYLNGVFAGGAGAHILL